MTGGREGRSVSSRAQGYTLVELLLLLVLISILGALARPIVHRVSMKARAAQVVEELTILRTAVFSYRADHDQWPLEVDRGTIPPGLRDYLPEGFSLRNSGYTLDYDDWSWMRDPLFEIGLSCFSSDVELGYAVMARLGSNVWSDGRTKITWVVRE